MVDRRRRSDNADAVPTISDLINQHRGDRSYRDLALRAERAGFHIKFQTINDLAIAPPRQWPKNPETIAALAAAIDVNVQTVVLAFARSFGLDVGRHVGARGLTNRELLTELGSRLDDNHVEAYGTAVTHLDDARSPVDPAVSAPAPNELHSGLPGGQPVKRAARRIGRRDTPAKEQ